MADLVVDIDKGTTIDTNTNTKVNENTDLPKSSEKPSPDPPGSFKERYKNSNISNVSSSYDSEGLFELPIVSTQKPENVLDDQESSLTVSPIPENVPVNQESPLPVSNVPDGQESPLPVSSKPENVPHDQESPLHVSTKPENIPDGQESPLPVSTHAVPDQDQDKDNDPGPSQVSGTKVEKIDIAMESPAPQAMERLDYDPNRIPSSVFDRTKSVNPGDWSMCSNESLFSLHTGNMSFTKDILLFRSGELGLLPGETEPSTSTSGSGQMFNFSANHQSPSANSVDSKSDAMRTEAAVEIMKEVIRESEDHNRDSRISRMSAESGNSTKSFAFPVLAGDADQSTSVRMGGQGLARKTMSKPKPRTEPESRPAAEATPQASKSRWFSCFSCCPFCS